MPTLSDFIERYLKDLLDRGGGVVEIQRSELAGRFRCVPSQINYVLETRFTAERGYVIESRRGGGGYIRIVRLPLEGEGALHEVIAGQIGDMISQDRAEHCVLRLLEEGIVTRREARMMLAAVQRDTLKLDLPMRDALRASLLKAMVLALLDREGPHH